MKWELLLHSKNQQRELCLDHACNRISERPNQTKPTYSNVEFMFESLSCAKNLYEEENGIQFFQNDY